MIDEYPALFCWHGSEAQPRIMAWLKTAPDTAEARLPGFWDERVPVGVWYRLQLWETIDGPVHDLGTFPPGVARRPPPPPSDLDVPEEVAVLFPGGRARRAKLIRARAGGLVTYTPLLRRGDNRDAESWDALLTGAPPTARTR